MCQHSWQWHSDPSPTFSFPNLTSYEQFLWLFGLLHMFVAYTDNKVHQRYSTQVWITKFYLQTTPYLPLPWKHSPDGATTSLWWHTSEKHLIVFTDCKPAICIVTQQSLQWMITMKSLIVSVFLCRHWKTRVRISVAWTPDHAWIFYNECADIVAREALYLNSASFYGTVLLPACKSRYVKFVIILNSNFVSNKFELNSNDGMTERPTE